MTRFRKKADAESRNGNHHIKSDYEPQPSTSKQDGLDREELVTNV